MKKNMVKVKLLVSTAYQGPRKEGDVVLVPEDFAARWTKNKIAEYVETKETDEVVSEEETVEEVAAETEETEEVVDEPVQGDVDYSSMSAKELYALCKEKGLEVEAKKSKEYYIEKLS